jgi:hypothetical protein
MCCLHLLSASLRVSATETTLETSNFRKALSRHQPILRWQLTEFERS